MRIFLLAAASLALPFSNFPARACPDQGAVVRRIEFAGLRRISSETLRAHITSRAGQPLDSAQVAADVRALDGLGWFDSVAAETYPADDPSGEVDSPGLRLVFQMAERPFLAGVEFRGSAELAPDRIKALLNENRIRMKLAAPVDRAGLWRSARIIERSLADRGRPQARVRVRLDAVPTASVRAVFEIDDGPRITAGRVAFSGVHAFPEALLRRKMQRVAPEAPFAGLRGKDIYALERLAGDVDRLESWYRDHGYPQVRVGSPEVQIVEQRARRRLPWLRRRSSQRLQVLIPVDEGPVCYFGRLVLEGEALSAILKERADALPEIRALRTGALFSQEKVERAREAVTRLLTQETVRVAGGARAPSSPGGSLVPQVDLALRADPGVSAVRVA